MNTSTPLLKKAGLPNIRFHDLRHTAATLLLLAGIHPKVVSEMLGHSSVTITLSIYSHVTPAIHRAATLIMDQILMGFDPLTLQQPE
jgi:integrase